MDQDCSSSPDGSTSHKQVKVSFSGDRSTETEWRIPPQEQIILKDQQVKFITDDHYL